MELQAIMNRAVIEDLKENLDTLFAVSDMAKRGESEVVDFVVSDILRELQQEPGPVVFPRLRSAVVSAIRGAKYSFPGSGMGEIPGLVLSLDEESEKAGSTTASESGFDWGKFATSLLTTVVTVGANIYNTKQIVDLEKDKLDIAQTQAAAAEQSAAQQVAAYRQQQVLAAQQAAQAPAASAGLPSWVLPAGIAAAGLVAVLMFMKR